MGRFRRRLSAPSACWQARAIRSGCAGRHDSSLLHRIDAVVALIVGSKHDRRPIARRDIDAEHGLSLVADHRARDRKIVEGGLKLIVQRGDVAGDRLSVGVCQRIAERTVSG